MCCLRCLREFEKWSKVEKIGKNEEKWGKKAVLKSPIIHYLELTLESSIVIVNCKCNTKSTFPTLFI